MWPVFCVSFAISMTTGGEGYHPHKAQQSKGKAKPKQTLSKCLSES